MNISLQKESTPIKIFKVNKMHCAWQFWLMFAKHKIIFPWPNVVKTISLRLKSLKI